MELTIKEVKNPVWANKNHTAIDVEVKFKEITGGFLPFTATKNDKEIHGKKIFKNCLAGEYGEIQEYIEPEVDLEVLTQVARDERNLKLQETDWTQLNDVPEETKQKWVNYRQKLRDVPQQEGFPHDIKWPRKPSNT